MGRHLEMTARSGDLTIGLPCLTLVGSGFERMPQSVINHTDAFSEVAYMTQTQSVLNRQAIVEKATPKSLRQRVLVVEDELIIGEIAAEALTDAGFEVFTASSAEEAEVILADVSIDVLFTDVDLGGRDGFDLAQSALFLQPLLSVVFTSGRSRTCHGMCSSVGVPFLAKPYRLPELVETIERVLDRDPTQ
jgi:CheY-like chemotaxis protein